MVKKKKGEVEKFGIPLLSILGAFILIMMYMTYSADLNKKDNVDILAREYILKMETEGQLNSTDESELITELQHIGLQNINLTGTTKEKVGYGNKVTLIINGSLPVSEYSVSGLNPQKTDKLINLSIIKSSTAKY